MGRCKINGEGIVRIEHLRLPRVDCSTANIIFSKKLTCFNSECIRISVIIESDSFIKNKNLNPGLNRKCGFTIYAEDFLKCMQWVYTYLEW